MKIQLHEVPIRELVKNYSNHDEEWVFGYGGALNIRPKYQREFVYKDEKRNEVIRTVRKDFPLNTLYWSKNADGTFEVLDGQQRIISICEYVEGNFSLDGMYFHSLTDAEQEQILDYKLMVYFCEWEEREKLDWFQIINIAGEVLTPQELRNAVFTGPWLTSAKKYFSKTGCPAYQIGQKYISGKAIRQEILEKAIFWISNGNIEEYMSAHQYDKNDDELRTYFQSMIDWIEKNFTHCRNEMCGLDWGNLYNNHKNDTLDPADIEAEIAKLMQDDDVENKKWIYEYILTRKDKTLNLRTFSDSQRRAQYEKQCGICPQCEREWKDKIYKISEMEADHITPWHLGGKTTLENCQMLCIYHNRKKSGK